MRDLTSKWRPLRLTEITDAIFKVKDLEESGPTTSFKALDRQIGGVWRDGVAVTGRDGAGKSIFVSHLAMNFVIQGHEVLYLDLENNRFDVLQRMFLIFLSSIKGKGAPTRGQISESPERYLDDRDMTIMFEDHIGERLWIVDAAYEKEITPQHLDELIGDRLAVLRERDKQFVVVLDSVNVVNSLYSLAKSEYESLQKWMAEITHIKAKYEIPIILVCHVTQSGEAFKGSSFLKHFARTSIILERTEDEKNVVNLDIARSQFGETGHTRLFLDRTRLLLRENVVTIP